MRKREFRAMGPLEIRQDLGDPLTIRGYAAVFNELSQPIFGFRERILPGAFQKSLSNDVRALVNHDPSQIIGRTKNGTLALREDDHGLYAEIRPPNTTLGRDTVESIRRGDLDQMSFGFQVGDKGEQWKVEDNKQVRELTRIDLFDVSIVAFPAYTQTEVSVRSLWPDGIPEEVERSRQMPPDPPPDENRQDEFRQFEIQSLIFPKEHWDSVAACKKWASDHDFKSGDVDETENSWRIRQRDPGDFPRLRTICINPGDEAADSEKCRVKAVGGPVRSYRERFDEVRRKLGIK